mmetsp:Transcript_15935/g.38416  ORF Transcript_15935/g.38416 Transcript_15935/m.38416 type:complete len:224 (-) Transcript_15935:781-1452(-)
MQQATRLEPRVGARRMQVRVITPCAVSKVGDSGGVVGSHLSLRASRHSLLSFPNPMSSIRRDMLQGHLRVGERRDATSVLSPLLVLLRIRPLELDQAGVCCRAICEERYAPVNPSDPLPPRERREVHDAAVGRDVRADRQHLVDEVLADREFHACRGVDVWHHSLPLLPAREERQRYGELVPTREGSAPASQLVAPCSRHEAELGDLGEQLLAGGDAEDVGVR